MSLSDDRLTEVPAALFSEGPRAKGGPKEATESDFAFADRVRQPFFERERRWYEDAFAHYPAGPDQRDLRARFRSSDDFQHGGAKWELFQHELWRRLGWHLTPHPNTADGRRRDFLVERESEAFILECAVDNASVRKAGQERRWQELWAGLQNLRSSSHSLLIHREAIGDRTLAAGRLVAAAQHALDVLPADHDEVVLTVDTDGWKFHIEATTALPPGQVAYTHSGALSMEERLYNPIRNRVRDKSRRSSGLDVPFVLALQIVTELPIVSKEGAVRGALMGTQTQVLGFNLETAEFRPNNDGPWVTAGEPRGRGLSAVLLHEGMSLGLSLPVLHHHPGALRPFDVDDLPFEQVRYDVADTSSELHQPARRTWHEVFDLPPAWPGPEDAFEGINTDAPMPPPAFWSPNDVEA